MTFVDTNVFVYASLPPAPAHHLAVEALRRLATTNEECWVSRQVVREYLATLTRPQLGLVPEPAAAIQRRLAVLHRGVKVADETEPVAMKLFDLLHRYAVGGKQVHDANIVATMLVHGIPRLLTANPGDFRRYEPEIEVVALV